MHRSKHKWKEITSWRKEKLTIKLTFYCGLVMHINILFKGLLVNGKVLEPIEAKSSPSHITVMKGSSVWLHWHYTYLGDGTHYPKIKSFYNGQFIKATRVSDRNVNLLAKRIGQNGALTLQSSLPAPFNGRVEVISSNSTLVIHRLQYSDSLYQYSSNIDISVDFGAGFINNIMPLRPTVSISVNGIPEFGTQPPRTFTINEGSNLALRFQMNGNPKPSVHFKWTHLPTSSATIVPSVQLHPFVYTSTYSLNNIDGSYCGRILHTTIQNSIGSSSVKTTSFTVLFTLEKNYNLRAGKIAQNKCVEARWNKIPSGACRVRYDTKFADVSGKEVSKKHGFNSEYIKLCGLGKFDETTQVELTVTYKAMKKVVTAPVSNKPIPSTASVTKTATLSSIIIAVLLAVSLTGSPSSICHSSLIS